MFDLQALAFASDVTRVFVFKLSRDVSNRVFPESGSNRRFHPISHHAEKEDKIAEFQKINTYHVSLVPYLLEKLKNTPDGDGNLLDNTPGAVRIADGRLERPQSQARARSSSPAARTDASRAICTSRRPTARRWRTRCFACCTRSASTRSSVSATAPAHSI